MLSPTNTRTSPPQGWSVTIPNAGPEIRNVNFSAWIAEVIKRLESNGMDRHGWKEWVLDMMCRQRPDIPCEDLDNPRSREVTADDVKRFFRTIWEAWQDGATAVPQEEQDRRAAICIPCPSRGHVSCFGGCGTLAQIASEMVMGTKSKPQPELHKTSCLHCGCDCSLLIMFPLEVLQRVDEKIEFKSGEYPSHCWKIQNMLPNDMPSSPQPPEEPMGT